MKKRDSKSLLRKIRKYILWGDVYRYGIAIIMLLVPVLLAASSIWLNLLVTIFKEPYNTWIFNNLNTLNSLFGIIAGSYLTIYATYFFEKKKEDKKNIGTKELAFYKPMFDELNKAIECRDRIKMWRFNYDEHVSPWYAQWTFWNSTQNSLIKYIVPRIFIDSFKILDNKIKEYEKVYRDVKKESVDIFIKTASENGLENTDYIVDSSSILDRIFSGRDAEYVILKKQQNNVDINAIIKKAETEIGRNEKYICFENCSLELDKEFEIVLNGVDYMLKRIYKRYNGKNVLL